MERRTNLAGAFLLCTLLAAPAVAQQIDLKKALPANTILYVAAPDINTSVKEMMEMPLLRMWKETEVQDFFASALKLLDKEWNKGLTKAREMHKGGQIPFDPDELLKLRLRSIAFAVTALDLSVDTGRPMPKFGLLVHLDFGESAPQWRKLIDYGVMMAEMQSEGMLAKDVSKVGDTQVTSLVPHETDMSLNVAYLGSGLLFGTLNKEVKAAIESLQSGKGGLPASENFKATFKNLDAQGPELEFYFQPGPLLDFGMKVLHLASEAAQKFPKWLDPAGVARAVDALGLNSIKAVGGTSSYSGTKAVTKSYVYAPLQQRKGLFAGSSKPLDTSFLRWVPRDAAGFGAGTFDLGSVYDGIVGALKAYDPQLADQLLAGLSEYEKQHGISLKGDLIGSVGDEYITWSMPMAAIGTTPEMAILVKVKDQDRFLKALRTATGLTNGVLDVEESERRGMKVYQLQINLPISGMGFNPLDMFIPTFAFKNGYLVAGFSMSDVKRVFGRMDREDDPKGDIRTNVEFAPYLKQIPQTGISTVSFTDWKANFEGLYQLVTSLAAFVPVDEDIPIDLSLLPDVATLTKHLFGSVSWGASDADGWSSHSVGPWGPETAVIVGGAVGAAVTGAVVASKSGRLKIR